MKINYKDLKGLRALITGASSGIGEEYAKKLASYGVNLTITARRIQRLETLAQKLRDEFSVEVECIELDLSVAGSAQKLFEQSASSAKDFQILVNNAGIGAYGPFVEETLNRHQATLQVNVTSLTELTYLFCKHMLKHGKSSFITNVASIAAFQATPYFAVYSGSKSYTRIFSQTLKHELKNTNISVSCLCPGGTYTEFLDHSGQKLTESGHFAMMSVEDVVKSGIEGMIKNYPVIVPGTMNKLACFLPRLLPTQLGVSLAFSAMKRSVKRQNATSKQETQ